jgi:hypothetical protein
MFPMHSVRLCILLMILLVVLAARNDRSDSPPTPTAPAVVTPDPALATPQLMASEEPLQRDIAEILSISIASARQPKVALAAYLKTTAEQLNLVNPTLPDPIAPGTLVVIPPAYRTAGETLAEVTQKTSLPEDLLAAANPNVAVDQLLAGGSLLAMPGLYIVAGNTPR